MEWNSVLTALRLLVFNRKLYVNTELANVTYEFKPNNIEVRIQVINNDKAFQPNSQFLQSLGIIRISRCGIVYYSPSTLKWKSILNSWLLNNSETISKYDKLILNLCDWAIPACIKFVNENCWKVYDTCDNNMVKNMTQLLQIFLDSALSVDKADYKEDDIKNLSTWMQAIYLLAVIWSIGGILDNNSRIKFDKFCKQLWKGKNPHYPYPDTVDKFDIMLPQEGTLFDYYYVFKQRGNWKSWSDLLKNEKIADCNNNIDYLVPTCDSIRLTYFITNYIKQNFPVLLVGENCTGKSLLVQDIFYNKLNQTQYQVTTINVNKSTTPKQIQKCILLKLNKAELGQYTTTNNRKYIIHLDDVNLLSSFNTENNSSTEFLRIHLDHKISYDLNNLNTIYLRNVYFIISMGLLQERRQHLCPRFLRHFSIFALNQFCEETVLRIYSHILHARWKKSGFPTDISTVINTIVSSTYHLYNAVKNRFKPTPKSCHYIFNLRDIGKIIQGCCSLRKETYDANKKIYFKLWYHEILRVFRDRIYNIDEKDAFQEMVKNVIVKNFKDELDEIECTERNFPLDNGTVFFSTDAKQYDEITLKQLYDITNNYINEYNEVNKFKLNIVLFNCALEYLSKICRIISMTNSNAILIGLSGSGRQTLTKLACFIYKTILFKPNVTQSYNSNEFYKDLKYILIESGANNKDCVCLLSEEQILDEMFLQHIDYILNNNEISNMYDMDEMQEILETVRISAQENNRNVDDINSESVLLYFNRRCKENLHIFLCLSSIQLRKRFYTYTSLAKCNIIWFTDWPDESLNFIAQTWIKNVNIDENLKKQLPDYFTYIYRQAQNLTLDNNSFIHITISSYLHFINLYIDLIERKQTEIERNKSKYLLGLQKLSSAGEQIAKMQETLAKYQPQLEEMTLKATEMTKQIALDTIEVETASAMVRKDEKIAHEQAEVAQILKMECEAELAQAIPILEDAISALNTLKPTDITLVKSMKNPPDAIKLVMAAVCVIKDVRPDRIPDPSTGRKTIDYWGPSKRILGDMNFLQSLKDFDKDNIKPEIMVKIRKEYLPHKDFKPHIVAKASSAAEGLCKWIIAMDMYDKVAKEVAPKKEKLEKAEREYATTMAILNQKKEEVARIEEKLAAMNLLLEEAQRKQQILQNEVNLCNRKLQRAQKLIGGLSEEKIKWTQTVDKLENQYDSLSGDILLSSALIAYLGTFKNHSREKIINNWHKHIQNTFSHCSNEFNFIDILSLDSQIEYWVSNGLPDENNFIINAMIHKYTKLYTIFIDPQYQASEWIKKVEKQNGLVITKFAKKDFFSNLKQSITTGKPILIQTFNGQIPMYMFTILSKQIYSENNHFYIDLNNEKILYNHNFEMYIVAYKLYNKLITPELCKVTTAIDFQITESALTKSLVKIVIETEKPEYKSVQRKLNQQNSKNKHDINDLDEKILYTLSKSEIDILENEEAIKILDESKISLKIIRQSQVDAVTTKQVIIDYTYNYLQYAEYAAELFKCVHDLQNIHFLYQFSLDWYKNLYFNSILNSQKSKCHKKRSEYLIFSFTYDLLYNISRSLFEKDKLLFYFLLSLSILTQRGDVTLDEYKMFIKGPQSLMIKEIYQNPINDLITDKAWNEFCQLENLPVFNGFINSFTSNISYWRKIFHENILEQLQPPHSVLFSQFHKLLILRFIKTDYLYINILKFVQTTLNTTIKETHFNLINDVYNESYCLSPIIFILSSDINPIDKIESLVVQKKLQNKFHRLSLGPNRESIADKLIEEGRKEGWCILLENCHLNPTFLYQLDEKIIEMNYDNTNDNFRLWITLEPTTKIPISLLQNCIKIIDQPPQSLKDNLRKLYCEEPVSNLEFFNGCPGKHKIFTKSLFALSYFHVVVRERFKYDAMSCNIPYIFNKTNFNNASTQLKIIINKTKYNVKELSGFICESNYSELTTNKWDFRLSVMLLKDYLNANICRNKLTTFCLPSKNDYQDYINHISKLPDENSPEIIQLHPSLIHKHWRNNIVSLLTNLGTFETDIIDKHDRIIKNKIDNILNILPKLFDENQFIFHPIILNEIKHYNQLIKIIKTTLKQLNEFLNGVLSTLFDLSEDCEFILNNRIPDCWKKYSFPSQTNLSLYINELNERCKYFRILRNKKIINNYWLSSFYYPKALLCWTKLNYSRKYNISLENIAFDFQLIDDHLENHDGIIVSGLFITGARWNRASRTLDIPEIENEIYDKLPDIKFQPIVQQQDDNAKEKRFLCPLYKTDVYEQYDMNFITSVLLNTNVDHAQLVKSCVALFCEIHFKICAGDNY